MNDVFNFHVQKDQALAKLRKDITDEKNKCDRIRKIAKKYKESGKVSEYSVNYNLKTKYKMIKSLPK